MGLPENPPALYCLRSKCFVSPSPHAELKGRSVVSKPKALGRTWNIDFRWGFIDKSRRTGLPQPSGSALFRSKGRRSAQLRSLELILGSFGLILGAFGLILGLSPFPLSPSPFPVF